MLIKILNNNLNIYNEIINTNFAHNFKISYNPNEKIYIPIDSYNPIRRQVGIIHISFDLKHNLNIYNNITIGYNLFHYEYLIDISDTVIINNTTFHINSHNDAKILVNHLYLEHSLDNI